MTTKANNRPDVKALVDGGAATASVTSDAGSVAGVGSQIGSLKGITPPPGARGSRGTARAARH